MGEVEDARRAVGQDEPYAGQAVDGPGRDSDDDEGQETRHGSVGPGSKRPRTRRVRASMSRCACASRVALANAATNSPMTPRLRYGTWARRVVAPLAPIHAAVTISAAMRFPATQAPALRRLTAAPPRAASDARAWSWSARCRRSAARGRRAGRPHRPDCQE